MLGKSLSRAQWVALLLLFIGVSVVQLDERQIASPSPSKNTTSNVTLQAQSQQTEARRQSPTLGQSYSFYHIIDKLNLDLVDNG